MNKLICDLLIPKSDRLYLTHVSARKKWVGCCLLVLLFLFSHTTFAQTKAKTSSDLYASSCLDSNHGNTHSCQTPIHSLKDAISLVQLNASGKVLSAKTIGQGKDRTFRIKVLLDNGLIKVFSLPVTPIE